MGALKCSYLSTPERSFRNRMSVMYGVKLLIYRPLEIDVN